MSSIWPPALSRSIYAQYYRQYEPMMHPWFVNFENSTQDNDTLLNDPKWYEKPEYVEIEGGKISLKQDAKFTYYYKSYPTASSKSSQLDSKEVTLPKNTTWYDNPPSVHFPAGVDHTWRSVFDMSSSKPRDVLSKSHLTLIKFGPLDRSDLVPDLVPNS
ncbi:uncharacterized protein I206_104480 [Kwoniella pini CBS 10737]|uniref:Uncharacterized protein n=1 Tax=Kwoniella pini CBS 10737 TaxID=1296096 RepID=A0A1B9I721_9TREE|nr:uncharacterized protein I206_02010 [Kwoniella pini CBS 10737]OCF51296.1 hypothetical protein I206_02010 [Kwoniella pini CBS 10737]